MKEISRPSFDLTGKSAIVTGATRGIGFGIASTFAMYGCSIVITSRSESDCTARAAEISEKYGVRCIGVAANSTSKEDAQRAVACAVENFGKLDILVNNAGITGSSEYFWELPDEDFDKVIDTNLKGAFIFSQAAAVQMIKQCSGRIINIASNGGLIGSLKLGAYAASKAGVMSLTRTMANELARYNICVNSVCPGYVLTAMNEKMFSDPAIRDRIEKKTAFRRIGTVEEIAGPVLAMASDCFSYMTGANVVIDGGQVVGK